jgi:hypothetical protein
VEVAAVSGGAWWLAVLCAGLLSGMVALVVGQLFAASERAYLIARQQAEIESLKNLVDVLWVVAREHGARLPKVSPVQMVEMVVETAAVTGEPPSDVFRRLIEGGEVGS